MSLLFDLPYDLYNEVCSQWLKTIDMGKLDSSLCQSEYRALLLNQLQDNQMEYGLGNATALYYNWMYVRNIPMKTLKVNENLYKRGELKCNVRWHEVQTLNVMNMLNISPITLNQMVVACTNLTMLEWGEDVHNLYDCDGVKTLTSLKLYVSSSFERCYGWIIEHCSKLHTLEIYDSSVEYKLQKFSFMNTIINVNSSTLRVINVSSLSGIPSEVFHCPNLAELTINSPIVWSDIVMHIKKLINMSFALGPILQRIEFKKSVASLAIWCYDIGEIVLCEFLHNFYELKRITVVNSVVYSDSLLCTITDKFAATLTNFHVCIPDGTSSQVLRRLFFCCKRLESFQFSNTSFLSTSTVRSNFNFNSIIDANYPKTFCIEVGDNCSTELIKLLATMPSFTSVIVKRDNIDKQKYKDLKEFIKSEQHRGREINFKVRYGW